MPSSSAMFSSFSAPITPPTVIPERKSSLPTTPPLTTTTRRPFAFGTRSPPPVTPRSGSMGDIRDRRRSLGSCGGVFSETDLQAHAASPATTPKKRFTIVAQPFSDEDVAFRPKRASVTGPMSPKAWAEQVALEGEPAQQWDARSSSSDDAASDRRASTSSSSSSLLSASGKTLDHQTRHSSFSSSTAETSSSSSSSAPNSSFTLASTVSTYTSASAGSSAHLHTPSSSKAEVAKLGTATVVRVVPAHTHTHSRVPTSTSSSSVEQKERGSIQDQNTQALLFALSESTRSLALSREENLALRAEVAELRSAIDSIRMALLEQQSDAGSVRGMGPGGENSLMSTLNSFASGRFPSMTSGASASKWSGGEDGGDEEQSEGEEEEMEEMLLTMAMPMPPMTVPVRRA